MIKTHLLLLFLALSTLMGCGKRTDVENSSAPLAGADLSPVEFYFYVNSDQDILGTARDGTIENQGEILADELESLTVSSRTAGLGIHIYLDRGLPLHAGDPVDSEAFDSCTGGAPTRVPHPETNSRDPENLKKLLAKSCYSNAKRFVIFWSHGNGFRTQKDFDYDPTAGTFHISSLISAIPDGFAEGVLFDSCSMASLEIASLLTKKAHYLLSSQFELPNEGLNYGGLITLVKTTRDSVEILKEIQTASEKEFHTLEINAPLIIVDLTRVDSVVAAFREAWTLTDSERESDYSHFRDSVVRGAGDGDVLFLIERAKSPELRNTLKAALLSGRGSLSFALPARGNALDSDFESVATEFPKLFRTWSEKFPNWADYAEARNLTTVPNINANISAGTERLPNRSPKQGALL